LAALRGAGFLDLADTGADTGADTDAGAGAETETDAGAETETDAGAVLGAAFDFEGAFENVAASSLA
jgi:hypothetical protein